MKYYKLIENSKTALYALFDDNDTSPNSNAVELTKTEYESLSEQLKQDREGKMAAKKIIYAEIFEKKKFLYKTDHEFNKYGEGYYTAEEYQPIKEARQAARDRINELEAEIAQLEK